MRLSFAITLQVFVLTLSALGLLGLRQATSRAAARINVREGALLQLERQLDATQVKIAQAHQPETLLKRLSTPLVPPSPERTVWLREPQAGQGSVRAVYELALKP